jgi:hypothetical protein
MAFNQAVFNEHLAEAAKATLPYYEYDSLWKAFNCFYSSFYRPDDRRRLEETAIIHRALAVIPEAHRAAILSQTLTQRFRNIEPIADARMWRQFDRLMTGRHARAKHALDEIWSGIPAEQRHLEAVVDVLYLVRCNMVHGEKSRYKQRDTDVFEATLPILRALVHSLPRGQQAEGVA